MVREVYGQIRSEFGTLGEPLTLHSPRPDLLAGLWCAFRESLVAGQAARALKEAVAVSVSRLNECPYCVDAHSVMLRAADRHDAAARLRDGAGGEIRDPNLRAAAEWGAATRTPMAEILGAPPFPPSEAPEFVGTAVWIHYINRMSTIFLGKNLIPLGSNPLGLRALAERMGGWYFAGAVRQVRRPGESLRLLPEKELPLDLGWASGSPPIARAFAAFAAAAEEAGARSLAPDVRECVLERITGWDGADPGLDTRWLETAVAPLDGDTGPAARLALLAALAPHRVGPGLIREYQARCPGDDRLLGVVSWSSFAAARRIGSWLNPRL